MHTEFKDNPTQQAGAGTGRGDGLAISPDAEAAGPPETVAATDPAMVTIFDTTMRDGEQSPGASMTLREKIEIADCLESMRVDVIEAGFPAASEGDFKSVSAIAERVSDSIVCGLSRARESDIDRCAEAVRSARRPRIHTFIATSDVHMKHKLNMGQNAVLEAVGRSVSHARALVDDVEWSAEDATRSDFDFLCRAIDTAISSGASTINIPDTVGYSHPEEFGRLIARLIETIPDSDRVIWSTHCHNDLGLAVANSLAGVAAGARQVECAINGLGERAGNAALEEIVMALRVRGSDLGCDTGIVSERLARASKMVSRVTGFEVQYNKAVVGKNAFAHESGIHQDGMLKNASTYEIMRPEDVGVPATSLVMGKHSGRHAFRTRLGALGYDLGDDVLNDAFVRFKTLADAKKHIFDDDIIALVDDHLSAGSEDISLAALRVVAGTQGPQTAELTLTTPDAPVSVSAVGNGPIDAIFNGIHKARPHSATLELYQVHAVTEGTDAQATVSVRLSDDGLVATGRASDPDTLTASARAYLHALNKLDARRAKKRSPVRS